MESCLSELPDYGTVSVFARNAFDIELSDSSEQAALQSLIYPLVVHTYTMHTSTLILTLVVQFSACLYQGTPLYLQHRCAQFWKSTMHVSLSFLLRREKGNYCTHAMATRE